MSKFKKGTIVKLKNNKEVGLGIIIKIIYSLSHEKFFVVKWYDANKRCYNGTYRISDLIRIL